MKKYFVMACILGYLTSGCNATKESQTTATETANKSDSTLTYSCPMHPDIRGKKGDKCSECGMDLEEVKKH